MSRLLALTIFASCCVNARADSGMDMIQQSGVRGGLVVHIGCGDGRFTAELRAGDGYLVQGLDADAENVGKARGHLQSLGLGGKVSVDTFDGVQLPYSDNLVNLVVAEELGQVSMGEVIRVLAPLGVALIDGEKTIKPWPSDIDEWTHYLHDADNNAVAEDANVAPPRHMQWLSHPLWSRHHDKLASISTVVTAKGRIFYISDEGPVYEPNLPAKWSLVAIDAFNGLPLWKRAIPSWVSHLRGFRSGPLQLQRLLVTDGERVFATLGLGEPVSVLDAATGDTLQTLTGTEHTEEILLHDGMLLVQTGGEKAEQAWFTEPRPADRGDYKTTKAVLAVNPDSGDILWQYPSGTTAEIMPRSLAASDVRVFCQERGVVVCLNFNDGKEIWRSQVLPTAAQRKSEEKDETGKADSKKGKKNQSGSRRSIGWTYDTLVVSDGVVLVSDNRNLYALAADTGNVLWNCLASTPFSRTPSVDILVVNGKVWSSPGFGEGRDLRTGEVVSSNNLQEELVTVGHHHRCYRNKATSRYIIQGYRGLEFRDTVGDDSVRHNWIRGMCQYGIMPANGLSYVPPHNCGCYSEAKLYGFWSLAAEQTLLNDRKLSHSEKLERGPAYSEVRGQQAEVGNETDWPIYRYDAARSGVSPTALPANLVPLWTTQLGGRLSAPVIARGTLLVSLIDAHQVLALDAANGKRKWIFTTGAPVDSPPSIHGDLALFGSADGSVYCVRLSDGELVWRFTAAPMDLRTVALGHVESLWPVHGSVLPSDDTIYFTAGRSTYLDGGMFLYGLDPLTGSTKHKYRYESLPAVALKNVDGTPNTHAGGQTRVDHKTLHSPDRSDGFSMAGGNISDVLVADGDSIYLRHERFDRELNKQDAWTFHLFSTSRLIDDNESHRSHWFFGRGDFSRIPVAYEWLTRGGFGGFQSPFAKLFVYDGTALWGTTNDKKDFTYNLFSYDISSIGQQVLKDFPRHKNEGAVGPVQLIEQLPMHPRALIKAGNSLVLAGFPMDESIDHQYGRPIGGKGILQSVSASTGKTVSSTEFVSPPVFDGMAAAEGRVFISLEDGQLICLGEGQ